MASSADLFVPIKFTTTVQLKPNEIGKNMEEIIYTKLKNNLENMCSKHGYIKKNSIKIIKRSIGQIKIPHFNGQIVYDVQCIAEICNPAQGSIIKCRVKAKNALGLLAEGYYDNVPILQIIIPKISAGMQSEINIDTVNIGEEVNIEVCGKKFLLYDKHISIIGKVIKDKVQNITNIVNEEEDNDDESDMLGGDILTTDIEDIVDEEQEGGDDEEQEGNEEEEDEEEDDDIEEEDEELPDEELPDEIEGGNDYINEGDFEFD
jgi:DNA-directed RNA polymerase subunit E'/Rpb7